MILLDTHVLVWTVADSKRLSRAATREIEKFHRQGGIAISAITLWELSSLFARGRIHGYGSVEASVQRFCDGVIIKPITVEIAALATQFPEDYPGDPADRIIGATARAEGLTLITRNENMRKSPLLKAVW